MTTLPEIAANPVTSRDQLVAFFTNAEKPKSNWLIGPEYEHFLFHLNTNTPVTYDGADGLRAILTQMTQQGWSPLHDDSNVIGLARGAQRISLEPGGQFELAGAPVRNLHEAADEYDAFLAEMKTVLAPLGVGMLSIGYQPNAKLNDLPFVPKSRYAIMREHLRSGLGHNMMLATASTQVSLDFASETDARDKFRVASSLQPVVTALFAASPFKEGVLWGGDCYRGEIWRHTERGGLLPFIDTFSFDRYTDWVLEQPVLFLYRSNTHVPQHGLTFAQHLKSGQATEQDWALHISTLFPDVRLKPHMELRGADAGPGGMQKALAALWVGLLYDDTAQRGASALVKEWSYADVVALRDAVPTQGLKAEIKGRALSDVAFDVVTLAQQGLRRRAVRLNGGPDETRYIEPLLMIAESGASVAHELRSLFENDWAHSVAPVFEKCRVA